MRMIAMELLADINPVPRDHAPVANATKSRIFSSTWLG